MRFVKLGIILCFLVLLSSCATVPVKPPVVLQPEIPRGSIYHQIGPGETIWRISKIYDVTIEDIARANKLENIENIETGDILVIPGAARPRPIISLYPTNKWQYIIIHHSATDDGNALSFDKLHQRRGWEGVGYHFIIDNGTCGRVDGQIETSPRWIKQLDGAHCKANGMNHQGIGICLVGNFSRDNVSLKQLDSLVYLVTVLKNYYHIPRRNIIGHGNVRDAATECPGENFPWGAFFSKIK